MTRTPLLTAAAAAALLAAPAALAQTPPYTTPPPDPPAAVPAIPATPADPDAGTTGQPATPAMPAQPVTAAQEGSVIDVLRAQGNFTTLLAALDRANLTQTLASRPTISIFAPTDAAFAAMPAAERERLLDPANAQELRDLLLYHVIVADVSSEQIEGARGPVPTAARTQVQLDGTGDAIRIGDATVIRADLDASNGAVFAIDRVLSPSRSGVAMGDEVDAAETLAEAPADEAVAEEAPAPTPPTLPDEAMPAPPAAPSPAAANPTPPTPTAPPTAGVTETPSPATGLNAPDGRPASSVITVASPPVRNPTDGQIDRFEDPGNPAPTPRAPRRN